MIFKKLIAAINANTENTRKQTRAMAYTISPQMVHDVFSGYLMSAGDNLPARVDVVSKITAELGVKQISELTYDKFFEALELLNEATS